MPKKKKKGGGAPPTTFGARIKHFFTHFNTAFPALCKRIWKGFTSAKTFWSAFAILVILLILSIVVLFLRLHSFAEVDERSVSLRSSMDESLNVFAMEYKNETGEVTIQGKDGEKVIAPGAEVEYTLRMRNTDKVALNYSFTPDLKFTSEYKLPIVVRLLDENDNYIIGNETTWVALDQIEAQPCEGTLMEGEAAELLFQWKWPFESGDDTYDTHLGSIDYDGTIGVDLSFALHAEANTTVSANGGFTKTPAWNVVVILVIFLLLAAVITLLTLYIIKRIRDKRNEKPIIVEVPVYPPASTVIEPIPNDRRAVSGHTARINIEDFEHMFYSGDVISVATLKSRGLIPDDTAQVKILSKTSGKLDKVLHLEVQKISKNAKDIVCRAGGTVTLVAPAGDKKN